MDLKNEIVNRVEKSGLVTLDLEQYYVPGERVLIDIAEQLFQGLVLREKQFRDYIKTTDWSQFKNKFVAITCSADAIIPTWTYMLLASALQPYARKIEFGNLENLEVKIFSEQLQEIAWEKFSNAKVVIKGCSKIEVPPAVYVQATNLLLPYAASIMFGEPCSTVPVFKRVKSTAPSASIDQV
jgi:hypothetical protein